MGKIQKLLTPRGSPKKAVAPAAEEKTRPSLFNFKAYSPKKSPKKLRKCALSTRASGSDLTSSFVLVSPPQSTSNQGPRPQPPALPLLTRSPIQTRSRTLALVPAPVQSASSSAPAPELLDSKPLSSTGPELLPSSSSVQGIGLTPTTPPSSPGSNQAVFYVDSFPGVKNIQTWNPLGYFRVPTSLVARSQPLPSHPGLSGGSPPAERRLLSQMRSPRVQRGAYPLRRKLETIPEDPASEAEDDDNLSLCSSSTFTLTTPQAFIIVKDEYSTPPQSTSSQNSNHLAPDDPRQSPSFRNSPSPPPRTKNSGRGGGRPSRPDPNIILASLFRMMEEDST